MCALAGSLVQPAPAAAEAPTCKAAQLRARVFDTTGAAGTIAVSITLQNRGAPCSLVGYARLRLRNSTGPLPTTVVHGGLDFLEKPVRRVRLARSGKATVLIAYNHVPSGQKPCPTANRLLIQPPGASGWILLGLRLDPCRRGRIYESPVLAGVRSSG